MLNISLKVSFIITKIFVVLLLVSVVSCDNQKKRECAFLDEAIMSNLDIDESIKWIVILPGMGCKGCIKEAELFMVENINNEEFIFVLTKIESLKIFQHKTKINVDDHHNIFLDERNSFVVPTDNSYYPCLIKIKDGYIVTHEFQSIKNATKYKQLLDQTNFIP